MHKESRKKENLRFYFIEKPLKSSIMATFYIIIAYLIARFVIVQPLVRLAFSGYEQIDLVQYFFWGVTRYSMAFACLYLVGIILNKSWFKVAFCTKGFGKGLIASTPWIAYALAIFMIHFFLGSFYVGGLPYFPLHLVVQIGTGFFEEALTTGLLMTPFLLSLSHDWNNTTLKRVMFTVACALFFMLVHFQFHWFNMIYLFFAGITFGAAYVYSKNLLAIILAHGITNAFSWSFLQPPIYDVLNLVFIVGTIICIAGIVFAIIITVRAKPFAECSMIVAK